MTLYIKFLLFTVSLNSVVQYIAAQNLPSSFIKCKALDPKFNTCLEHAIESALIDLATGYAPLGIYPFDPLKVTAIDIEQGKGPVSINLKFKDLFIKGFKNTKLSDVKSDLKKLTFTGKANIKKIDLEGKYSIDGKILILPVNGDGPFQLSLDDVAANFTFEGKRVNNSGEVFMKVTKFDFNFGAKKMKARFDNLFKGDKALGNNMNLFVNENWAEILNELKPAIQDTFGLAFAEIANRIFTKVPLKEVYEGIDLYV